MKDRQVAPRQKHSPDEAHQSPSEQEESAQYLLAKQRRRATRHSNIRSFSKRPHQFLVQELGSGLATDRRNEEQVCCELCSSRSVVQLRLGQYLSFFSGRVQAPTSTRERLPDTGIAIIVRCGGFPHKWVRLLQVNVPRRLHQVQPQSSLNLQVHYHQYQVTHQYPERRKARWPP